MRGLLTRAVKFVRLDPLKRAHLREAIRHLAWARLELSRKSPQALVESLQRRDLAACVRGEDRPDIATLSWALRAAASGVPWRSDCLVQSLAADRWLTRKGIPHEFRLGVREDEGRRFLAHAWIEVDGAVVTGGDDVGDYRLLISS